MPFFLLGLVLIGGGLLWWQSAHRYPEIPPNADALTLLNFPAYPLQPNKKTYRYLMGPEGLSMQSIINATGVEEARLVRKHIVLPGPTTVPAFADIWAVESVYTGPARVITPQALLEEQGVSPTVAQVEPARQLAGMLYASAFNPTTNKLLLVPIAGKQV